MAIYLIWNLQGIVFWYWHLSDIHNGSCLPCDLSCKKVMLKAKTWHKSEMSKLSLWPMAGWLWFWKHQINGIWFTVPAKQEEPVEDSCFQRMFGAQLGLICSGGFVHNNVFISCVFWLNSWFKTIELFTEELSHPIFLCLKFGLSIDVLFFCHFNQLTIDAMLKSQWDAQLTLRQEECL